MIDSQGLTGTLRDSQGLTKTHRDSRHTHSLTLIHTDKQAGPTAPGVKEASGTNGAGGQGVRHTDSQGFTGTHRDSQGLARTHRDSQGLSGAHRDSQGLTGTHGIHTHSH